MAGISQEDQEVDVTAPDEVDSPLATVLTQPLADGEGDGEGEGKEDPVPDDRSGWTATKVWLRGTTDKVFVAIDIETAGERLSDRIVAIGVSVGPARLSSRGPLHSFSAHTATEPWPWTHAWRFGCRREDVTDRCWTEFWSKHPVVWDCLSARFDVFSSFCAWLEELYATGAAIEWVGDAPSFDVPRLDYALHVDGGGRLPLKWDTDGRIYHSFFDVDSAQRMLYSSAADRLATQMKAHVNKRPHFPDDDAKHLYWQAVYLYDLMAESRPILLATIDGVVDSKSPKRARTDADTNSVTVADLVS